MHLLVATDQRSFDEQIELPFKIESLFGSYNFPLSILFAHRFIFFYYDGLEANQRNMRNMYKFLSLIKKINKSIDSLYICDNFLQEIKYVNGCTNAYEVVLRVQYIRMIFGLIFSSY